MTTPGKYPFEVGYVDFTEYIFSNWGILKRQKEPMPMMAGQGISFVIESYLDAEGVISYGGIDAMTNGIYDHTRSIPNIHFFLYPLAVAFYGAYADTEFVTDLLTE